MRYLITALGTVAILIAIPTLGAGATVGCGRVTTFVAPDSTEALTNGDGWMIFAKLNGSSEKVIIRSGRLTPTGSIGGYVCIAIDGLYFDGVLAPGTTGYIPEPADWVTGTGVYCGTVGTNPYTSGQISGPRTLQLRGTLSAFAEGIFRVPALITLPAVGSYLCGLFEVGGPSILTTILGPGDPGYVATGTLPSTSTAVQQVAGLSATFSTSTLVFAVIGALMLAVAVVLGMLGSFSYLAVAAVGMFFVAAALISKATRSQVARVPALLALVGVMLSLVGTVTTIPFLLLGVGLIATAGAIVLLFAVRSGSTPR